MLTHTHIFSYQHKYANKALLEEMKYTQLVAVYLFISKFKNGTNKSIHLS